MIATILKSKKATETTFSIIETFAKTREISRNIQALQHESDHHRQQGLIQRTGELLSDLIVEEADTKHIPMGTAYPSNDGNAVGITYEDVDVR